MGQIARRLSLLGLLITASSLAACTGLTSLDRLAAGEPKIDDSVWFRVDANGTGPHATQSYDASLPNYIPRVCLPIPENKGDIADPELIIVMKAEIIIECTSQMKIVIDRRFDGWMDSLASWTNDSNAAADVLVVGAGLAGSLAGGATSRIMNAVTSGITGTKKAINEDILLTKSVEIIITQMKTNRAQWATIIANRLDATRIASVKTGPSKPKDNSMTTIKTSTTSEKVVSKDLKSSTTTISSSTATGSTAPTDSPEPVTTARPYRTLSEAWDDLQTYSRQGAFNEALATIQSNVGAQSAACQAAKVNQKKGASPAPADPGAGSEPATGSAPGSATATSPCPTSASAVPSPVAAAPAAETASRAGAASK